MTEDEKQLFRQQQEGYVWLRRHETDELRRMTFADRVAAFDRIMSFAPYLPRAASRDDDDRATQAWARIRERYDATLG
jgi:hypothetical protein